MKTRFCESSRISRSVVARELAEEHRAVVVRRELRRVRVVRVVLVLGRAVRADTAGHRAPGRAAGRPAARPGASRRSTPKHGVPSGVGGAWFSGVNEYQTSGLRDRRRAARPGSTDGPPPTFQRELVERARGRVVALVRLWRRVVERQAGVEVPAGSTAGRSGSRAASRSSPACGRSRPGRCPRDRGICGRRVRVGRVVGHVRDVVLVDLDPERVPEAHRVDLGPRLGRARREQVAGGHRVGAAERVRLGCGDVAVLDLDAQHLAAQVVRCSSELRARVDVRRVEQAARRVDAGRW